MNQFLHAPPLAPISSVDSTRHGRLAGRFCRACGEFYPLLRSFHTGKPLHGKDHIASPCSHHGEAFAPGVDWWEFAVEVREPVVAQAVANAPAV